ncbi:ARID DNA-binding domain-containing protein [Tanacetum coccineum]|uniref:ARID DNA-binding domain-containing protein n=1 Tax=Tanacetum coccineum TaxID=301880 RepID=A0ABQ5AHF1_9ASTR
MKKWCLLRFKRLRNSLKVQTIEEFIQFMKLMNTDNISYKHKEVFTRKFNDTLKWFHKTKAGKDLEGKLSPKISNVEIYLFDFYKFVNNCGGYGKISQAGEWMEIAMYYGFPNYCDEDLKKTFKDYLLLPHTYYEFAKGRMPNKYTEGMGTFKDLAEGLGKPKKYTKGLGNFEDQGEDRKPNKYTKGLGTFEDQGEGMKPNKYTEGMCTFKDQTEGLADHFRTSAAGMDIASKHVSNNNAIKKIKKEDDDFVQCCKYRT